MILKYKYFVDSGLRFQNDLIFEVKGRSYEFEIDEQGFSTGIAVSVKANADQYALQITSLTNDVVKYHIHIKDEPASTSAPGDEAVRLTFPIDTASRWSAVRGSDIPALLCKPKPMKISLISPQSHH